MPATEAPLSPISLWQIGSIPSAHVLPGLIDIERLKDAVASAASLYPVMGGRLRRRRGRRGEPAFEYYIDLIQSPIKVTVETSDSLEEPFATPAVIQPTLHDFVDNLNPATQLDNPDAPLLSIKVTLFPVSGTSVIGLCWAHILGDGDAFSTFTRTLSRLYAGASVEGIVQPTFAPHVSLYEPTFEALAKWEIPQLFPSFPLPVGSALYAKAETETDLVQVTFSATEVRLLKTLARGASGWVSEQDGLSSYWINLLRLCGEPIDTVVNSINYRHHFQSDPRFPPNLPTLVANVAQMHAQKLPLNSSASLSPVAVAIRSGLEHLKQNPSETLEWLSCRAHRMQATIDAGEMQCLVPSSGECFVNSNWRYEWNETFGSCSGTTSFHTTFSTLNFLRVFRSNEIASDGQRGAECTWRMRAGLATKALEEIARDRQSGWSRWKQDER